MQKPAPPFFADPYVLGLALLALAVRLVHLPERALWFDEAYSVLIAKQPVAQIWSLVAADVHPPLYYTLLHLAMALFGDGLWVVRGLSALAGTLAVLTGGYWARRIASHRAACLVLLLLAVQPIAVRYSQEARMYALLAFWLMAASLMLTLWLQAPQRWYWPLLYGVLAAAALYTHYFAALGLAGHWVVAFGSAQGRQLLLRRPSWWLAHGLVLLLLAPWLPSLWLQLHALGNMDWVAPLSTERVLSTLWEFFWIVDTPLPQTLLWLGPLLIAWTLWLNPPRNPERSLVTLLALAPLVLAILVSLYRPLFTPRFLSFCALPLVMVLGLALDRLFTRPHRSAAWAALALTLVVQGGGLLNAYRHGEQLNGDGYAHAGVPGLAAALLRERQPGDEVVVQSLDYLSLLYYLRAYPTPWLWLTGDPPPFRGPDVLLYLTPRAPWLWRFSELPLSACGLWLFSPSSAEVARPPGRDWQAQRHREASGLRLDYFSRRACTAGEPLGQLP
ncbi:glycosyltransferase family 39 protein [Pseudomonas sp. HR96]|uniref:glycosyltransferase family 39 protein n=1 Tax=Pseudomonas sp. HR96 TaxID=1027966 RepID=UPI002A75E1C6|nr:glycosyltransferase family 39 protein [Pseudomonas sp. HR96]WPP02107.1 glycosyltransferase family 39 protein [Pseudomonas sp. HR96]